MQAHVDHPMNMSFTCLRPHILEKGNPVERPVRKTKGHVCVFRRCGSLVAERMAVNCSVHSVECGYCPFLADEVEATTVHVYVPQTPSRLRFGAYQVLNLVQL